MSRNPFEINLPQFDELGEKKANKKSRTSCPLSVKQAVWKKYNGEKMYGKCYVCGKKIHYDTVEMGHNIPASKGGKWTLSNCRPLCRSCNRSMGTMTIEAFKKKHFSEAKVTKKSTTKKSVNPKSKKKATPKKKSEADEFMSRFL